jgi:hypothetical protein
MGVRFVTVDRKEMQSAKLLWAKPVLRVAYILPISQ